PAPVGQAALEDYAYVAAALLDWAQLSNSESDRRLAQRLVSQAWRRFHGPQGWQMAENMLLQYGAGRRALPDGPLPAPSALLAGLSLEVADPTLAKQATTALALGHDAVLAQPFWHATRIRVVQRYLESGTKNKDQIQGNRSKDTGGADLYSARNPELLPAQSNPLRAGLP
ncbi:MAG: hypothetical protein JSW10_01805, partial [Pseudomonadota bacterium]